MRRPSSQLFDVDLFDSYKQEFQDEQTRIVDGDSRIRFRVMYLKNHDLENRIFQGCNPEEITELLLRKHLEDWLVDTPQARE